MTGQPAVLIDDDELRLVRAMLDDLGVDYDRLPGRKLDLPWPDPARLLVTTGSLAVEHSLARPAPRSSATWLAMVRGDSKSQRRLLRRAGFDMLVPYNVHPSALLLLLRRALFDGADTQRGARVAVGQQISFSTRLRQHRGVLVDLSPSGCRILTDQLMGRGARVAVRVVRPCGSALLLRGTVARTGSGVEEGGDTSQCALGIRFEPFRRAQREQLKEILRERMAGPSVFGPAAGGGGSTRVAFDGEVTAICGDATRALVGRDLDADGMRVEAHPGLSLGQRVRLALHGDQREEPFLIEAHVEQDTARDGLSLRFDDMDSRARRQLHRLITGLPTISRFEDDAPTYTAVLAKLLPGRR